MAVQGDNGTGMDDQEDIVEEIPTADKPEKAAKRKPRAKKATDAAALSPIEEAPADALLEPVSGEIPPATPVPRLYQLRSPGVRPALAVRPRQGPPRLRNDCPPDSRKKSLPHYPRTRLR
jgi:hypothetical protein